MIKFDDKNYRKHSDNNKKKIAKSLKEYGAGRSVVVDNDGVLIAGNGVFEQAVKLGLNVREVETDGTELVVVKRTDLHTDDEKRKGLAMADNATSDKVDWDLELLQDDFSRDELADWGIIIKDTELLSKLEYEGIYYEPEKQPNLKLEDCLDLTKFNKKNDIIKHSNLSEKQKEMLRWFTYRFIKIDFEAVANYYTYNATDEEKEVMERLRLVLIDNGVDGFIEDDLINIMETLKND